jgi:ParB-like chromosome segregation protein Spo0J
MRLTSGLLAEAAGSVQLPPILVQKSSMRIIDGMHRLEVAKLRGECAIRARIVDCSDEKALVLAVKSNTLHGLPLTRADRISSAKRILGAHPDWSDRKVAGIAGLSGKSIASLRNSSVGGAQSDGKRLGSDGKRRPVVAAEGRLRAAEYVRAHPEASVRQIASETEVSLGTAHDVRQKIHHGVDLRMAELSPRGAQAVPAAPPAPRPVTNIRARVTAGTVRRLAWSAAAGKLAGDPALKYTDGGRAILRWMTQHAMHPDGWREFVDAIPERWLEEVRQTAATMSEEWG